MKKMTWLPIFVLLLSLVITMTSSCNILTNDQTGSLSLTSNINQIRTIAPSNDKIAVVKYIIMGHGPDAETFNPIITTNTNVDIEELTAGTWEITIDGYNNADPAQKVASKTMNVDIQSGLTTSATFYLERLSGVGDMILDISWPASVESISEIRGILTPSIEGKESFTINAATATISNQIKCVQTTIEDLPVGSYSLKVTFFDQSGSVIGLPYLERINIYNELLSSGTVSVPEIIFPVEKPQFSPIPGIYRSNQIVTITSTTPDTDFYYTLDGSEPNLLSIKYSSEVPITNNTTIKAIALREGMVSSEVSTGIFEILASSPVFSLSSGIYEEPQIVTITSETEGVSLYYTTNGENPTILSNLYSTPIPINENITLKAIAVKNDMTTSDISLSEYHIKSSIPITSHVTDVLYKNPQSIVLTSSTLDAQIWYTTDGSIPTEENRLLYTGPIAITTNTSIKAYSSKTLMDDSDISTFSYNFKTYTPVINPTGGLFSDDQSVTMTCLNENSTIFFTTDGTVPTSSSTPYTGPFTISENTTIKAIGSCTGITDSDVLEQHYTIRTDLPQFSVLGGTYNSAINVTITSSEGSTIYYTIDGTDPIVGVSSSIGTGDTLSINASTLLKAIGTKPNMAESLIANVNYTILGTSGITLVNPSDYSVVIQTPDGWGTSPLPSHIDTTLTAIVTPDQEPNGITYTWYLDGLIAKNNLGVTASTTNQLELGENSNELDTIEGPHIITVVISDGSFSYSDSVIFSSSDTASTYSIRATGPAGGIIFYDDEADGVDNIAGYRFLELAPSGWFEESTDHEGAYTGTNDPNFNWGLYLTITPSARASAIGTGKSNTESIVNYHNNLGTEGYPGYTEGFGDFYENPSVYDVYSDTPSDGRFAAKICSDVVINGYDDWFLPSLGELVEVFNEVHQYNLGSLTRLGYWCSTEGDQGNDTAWGQLFNNMADDGTDPGWTDGATALGNKSETSISIRPIRAF